MVITKEILCSLELKSGKLSERRCKELNSMKIKNPYYPKEYFTHGEYFVAEDAGTFIFSKDECIGYVLAFFPYPIITRESKERYDEIYLLFIDDEWFEIIIDYLETRHVISDGIEYIINVFKLRDNIQLDKRTDQKEIIYLLEELAMSRYKYRPGEGKRLEFNYIYKGEEYQWKHWNA